MGSEEVGDGTTVAHHHILESPLVAQYLLKKLGTTATRLVVPTLVGTHHLPHLCLLHQVLECWHVCLPQVAWRHIVYICHVAAPFRTAVYGTVLGTSKQFTVFCRLRSLQYSHHGLSHK